MDAFSQLNHEVQAVARGVCDAAQAMYRVKQQRHELGVTFSTLEDFERAPPEPPRIVALGCTGAGKSTLLNVLGGNRLLLQEGARQRWRREPLLFESSHGCRAVTRAASYANAHFLGDPARPCVLVDTPGHDDTEAVDLDDEASRDLLREQAADLHHKLKALGHVDLLLVLHDNVASNRLNPATYTVLKLLDEKFGPTVWDSVVVAYSRCNGGGGSGGAEVWQTDLEQKKLELQAEIRRKLPGCRVDLPVLALGGLLLPEGQEEEEEGGEAADTARLEEVWQALDGAPRLSTAHLRPFEGAQWCQYEAVVRRHDEAVARADAVAGFFSVALRFAVLLLALCWRDALPAWASVLLLNLPSTWIDEFVLIGLLVGVVGPSRCWYTLAVAHERYLEPKLVEWGLWPGGTHIIFAGREHGDDGKKNC